jgi:hypothetical protein
MKVLPLAALVAVAVVAGRLPVHAAESARLRHMASVYVDANGAGLLNPEGVACGPSGTVVVGDTGNDRLLRFTVRDKTLSGGSEIKLAQLTAPTRVQISSTGDIFALDGKRRLVVRLGADGAFKNVVTFDGVPLPATVVVKSFALDAADNVYVLDVFAARVLVVGADGRFLKALALPPETGFVTDVTVDALGTVVVIDAVKRRLARAARDATSFTPLGGDLRQTLTTMPSAIAASRGLLFVSEGGGGSIASFGQDGTFLARQLASGWKDGSLDHPGQICVTEGDEMFVADRGNSRIQVFALAR